LPTHNPDLSRFSLTQLRELTGHAERTIRKRLGGLEPVAKDGRTVWYAARPALERIYLGESLDLTRERARLASEQADAQALRNQQQRGEVVPAEDMDRALIAVSTLTSGRLQGIPRSLAPELAAESTPAKCEAIVEKAILEALGDLADQGQAPLDRVGRAKRGARRRKPAGA